jgi:microcystin-dependent protein
MDEYLGMVKLFAGSFAPNNWAYCDGTLLSISQYSALYAVIGTTYGGNGTTTFALPDLRSRVAVGAGKGPGLTPYQPGQAAGTEAVSLSAQQMPVHSHNTLTSQTIATTNNPATGILAQSNYPNAETGDPITSYTYAATSNGQAANISSAGGSQPVSLMQPYLGMNYVICINGLFPSRS